MIKLPDTLCISKDDVQITYRQPNIYLGATTVSNNIEIKLTIPFINSTHREVFYDFWTTQTNLGTIPFYVKLPIYNTNLHYLLTSISDLVETFNQSEVSCTFAVNPNITLENNINPSVTNVSMTIQPNSRNNYVYLPTTSSTKLTFTTLIAPLHGIVANMGDGVFYYTPNAGGLDNDEITIQVEDSSGAIATGVITIGVIDFRLYEDIIIGIDSAGILNISHGTLSDIPNDVRLAVEDLDLGVITTIGEYTLDVPTTHIADLTSTYSDWLITPC